MNIFKNLFLFKKKSLIDNKVNHGLVDQYGKIAKLVKEARIQKNITIQELSDISKIPEQTIISIEDNLRRFSVLGNSFGRTKNSKKF